MKRSPGFYFIRRMNCSEPAYYTSKGQWMVAGLSGAIDPKTIDEIGNPVKLQQFDDDHTKPITLFGKAV